MGTSYSKGSHSTYHHRFHLVWITKYRYKIMNQEIKKRVRDIVGQVAEEMRVHIESGVVSSDHVHLFVSIPPHVSVSDFVQKAKRRSSRKIQMEFQPILKNRYWGRHFWARGFFSATSGNVTDEMIHEYINNHSDAHQPDHIDNIRLE